MKSQSTVKLLSYAGKFEYYTLGLLALLAVAASGPVQATLDKAEVVAVGSGAEVSESSVVTPDAAANGEAAKQPYQIDPDWQPPTAPKVVIPSPVDSEQARKLAEQWGVKLISLNLTSAGFMMDFRFRVLDADKALSLFDHRIKPYVVVERSNIKLPVPMAAKVGAMRPTNRGKNIKADKNYYMIFANPDRHVKRGEKVTVIIGDFKVEHLRVN
ncbi:MAG: hypothetical protein GY809_27215 [Planctomycetes bacterium]|nr:hypothetical protein [Planctomycetota bacterium]